MTEDWMMKLDKPPIHMEVAEIKLCGGVITIIVDDSMDFVKPTPEQIKNLHDMLCIDVELFD